MKRCPTCGAACGDEDAFCESDGTKLANVPVERAASPVESEAAARSTIPAGAAASSASPPQVSSCASCGATNPDDGDGYCNACGKRLAPFAPTAPAPAPAPAQRSSPIPGFRIVRELGEGDVLAIAESGEDVVLVTGSAGAIEAEARAIDALAKDPPAGLRPARVVARGSSGSVAFAALSAPPTTARRLWDAGPDLPIERALAAIETLLATGEALHAAGFDLHPAPTDLYVVDDQLALCRVRGARAVPGRALDAKALVEAIGECFLPEPAVRTTPRLVRLLAPNREASEGAPPSLAEIRAELVLVRAELAAELHGGPIAELADPGLWRPYQQDATAIAEGTSLDGDPWHVLVVCDGVSSSPVAGRASIAASRAARDALAHFARSPDLRRESSASAVSQAIRAAHLVVCGSHVAEPHENPPGTTIVAAFVHKKRVTVGWVGDSRAYWFTPRGGEQLTHDHSWVNEAIARGEVKSEDEVEGALAHTITKCLGPLEVGDAPIEIEPDVKTRDLPTRGTLVLCSDGLWNYASKLAEMLVVMKAAGEDQRASALARFLVSYALARGGQDNVSVAIYTHAG